MREIKFNFYNTFTKRYTRWNESNAGLPLSAFYTNETLRFLQFTGLKDKNGVEIYEGDILKCKIFGLEEIGLVKYSENLAAYFLTELSRSDRELWGCSAKEVIGNIYENPELLENPE